jgi:phosphate/sulfate permease
MEGMPGNNRLLWSISTVVLSVLASAFVSAVVAYFVARAVKPLVSTTTYKGETWVRLSLRDVEPTEVHYPTRFVSPPQLQTQVLDGPDDLVEVIEETPKSFKMRARARSLSGQHSVRVQWQAEGVPVGEEKADVTKKLEGLAR